MADTEQTRAVEAAPQSDCAPSDALLVPFGKKQTSLARVTDDWYVVLRARDLKKKPARVELYQTPIVVFRDENGVPHALLDRCAHRNVPLSPGSVVGGQLECPYHGWRFDGAGVCRRVPSLCAEHEGKARRVPSFPCLERDGFIWVYATPDVEPKRQPFKMPFLGEPGYTTVQDRVEARGTVHAVAENALDVPHTAFLHRGLFRADRERNKIRAIVRRYADRVEAEYVGEPRPKGIAGKLLAPGGGIVEHFDRFFLPSIVQVEYKLGRTHFCVTAALSPVAPARTRLFASISFRLPIPGWLVAPILRPIALRIFAQDAAILARQTENVERFGGEQFVSTDIDVMGQNILRLLRNAERADRGVTAAEPQIREVELEV